MRGPTDHTTRTILLHQASEAQPKMVPEIIFLREPHVVHMYVYIHICILQQPWASILTVSQPVDPKSHGPFRGLFDMQNCGDSMMLETGCRGFGHVCQQDEHCSPDKIGRVWASAKGERASQRTKITLSEREGILIRSSHKGHQLLHPYEPWSKLLVKSPHAPRLKR